MAATTVIDAPLPASEGFAFLCVVGASGGHDDEGDVREYPTVVVARLDMTPPRLPAQVRITETADVWRAKFSTVGQEVAFHLYKVGPPNVTRCDDPDGYRAVYETLIGLPKVTGPHLLCAIPYDAAQNAGPRWQRLLR
jgi:hypothetical protein